MKTRDREIRRRRARRWKTRRLKERLQASGDGKLKTRLTAKLKKINQFLVDAK